uniref:Uncharacterized protein n=1 Tax=Klebsiella pneumoniae subsp. pneumoniae TaxID=72407 RepID=A0A7G3L741_KLEPN|nr:hypothetical protein ICEJAFMC_00136 [Klebsiella pneumoniae subsp. pneumoniae]
MNDCLNWCISAFMLRKFAVAPSVPRLFWPHSSVSRAQVTIKLLFRHNNSLTQSANLPGLVFQLCMEYPAHWNQQSSDLLLPRLLIPNNVVRPPYARRGTQPCCRRKVTTAAMAYCFPSPISVEIALQSKVPTQGIPASAVQPHLRPTFVSTEIPDL